MPYYPIFNTENQALFARYHQAAKALPGLHLLGRLAEYKYYDMDDAVAAALRLASELERPCR
jgi:UDP-galactopyranose mutase